MTDESGVRNDTDLVYIGEERKHYRNTFKLSDKQQVKCLSKKQVKILYPDKEFRAVAEYAPGDKKSPAGVLVYENSKFNLSQYRTHSRVTYREKGFLSVGGDNFVALLKKVILGRVMAGILMAALIAAAIVIPLSIDKDVERIAQEPAVEAAAAQAVDNSREVELEEGAVDWEGVLPRDEGGITAGIAIPGYKSITIDANKTDVRVNLLNPEGNPCYFVISLSLDDGTLLYQSKMVEPGKGLYDIKLLEPIGKGQYPATVKYETFNLENVTPMNGAEVKITLIAE